MSLNLSGQDETTQEQFDVFSFRGRPILAICARDRRFRAAAARRYPIFSARRRLFRRMIQGAVALRLDSVWMRRGAIPRALVGSFDFHAWMSSIGEKLGRSDLFPVVHGPPQPERKRAYVHLLGASGQPVAFGKLGFDEFNNSQLDREIQTLAKLRDMAPRRFKTPLVLTHGVFNGSAFNLYEPLPTSLSPVSIPWELLRPVVHEIAGPLRTVSRQTVLESDWWNQLCNQRYVSPQFIRELESLMAEGLPVCQAHGDLGVNNLIFSNDILWIVDWEQGCEAAPSRTDEVSYFFSVRQRDITRRPLSVMGEVYKKFLKDESPEAWRDIVAALAFLAASGLEGAQILVARWDLSLSADSAHSKRQPGIAPSSQISIICNEPTSGRLQVQRRISAELGGVGVHNIFTHAISSPDTPSQLRVGNELNPVFFPRNHLTPNHPISGRSISLFRDIKKYIQRQRIQMIILIGYDDLTRLLLIRWARRALIPLVLAGDSNIFADAAAPASGRLFRRFVLNWVLRRVAGLMPMGTCGRAFFRQFLDHNLPEFLFPYEPDYASLDQPNAAALDRFRTMHRLVVNRKRLLFCGGLVPAKCVDTLLLAFMRVTHLRPEWDLVIVGEGPLRKQLENMVPQPLRERVQWLGPPQADEGAMAYHACDVLVDPAEIEPWGLVINEATACRLPIIATSVVGAAVELVYHQRNGLIVAPRSVESLSNAILLITRSDRYLQMSDWCDNALQIWRKSADPVNAVRAAMKHFGLHWTPAAHAALSNSGRPSPTPEKAVL
jgi:glycosyltransferase involved in cell wall biosynthesis